LTAETTRNSSQFTSDSRPICFTVGGL